MFLLRLFSFYSYTDGSLWTDSNETTTNDVAITVIADSEDVLRDVSSERHSLDAVQTVELVVVPVERARQLVVSDPARYVTCR